MPVYNYELPQALLDGMGSEDPATRATAIKNLLRGVSETIHREVVRTMRMESAQVMPQMAQLAIRQHAQQQQIFNDFYGKYPELSNPSLRPTIQAVAAQVAQRQGFREWSPQFRDAIGTAVKQMLQSLAPVQQMPPTSAPHPHIPAPAARPAPPAALPTEQQQMLDLLNF